ncbi:MAG: Na+/H+ antiporter NhaA [Elusimicrobia bacterium CG11_big_fil_rev_8_21_14_0_20_64_6]|nr:MAG: Na+/H+ antiporter NhaA [Elusimicrobia bacterium CG11_big_fil_rev_8_21_14_0_20_64_6]
MIAYHAARRAVMIAAGFIILATGIAMVVLPGPAILVIPLGLSLLAGEFIWARRLLARINAIKDHFAPAKERLMTAPLKKLTNEFLRFIESEKAGGVLLILCTAFSLVMANSAFGREYADFWRWTLGGLSLEHWINDALMAIFFLLIGLEIERELYSGELSNIQSALLPLFAALGGLIAPALIHYTLNAGTMAQAGIGIPMATDIAFAVGIIAILGNRIPAALKVLIVAFAVMDDLAAIILIAMFYTANLSAGYLIAALAVWALLAALNRIFRVMSLTPYILGGAVLWFLMLESGIHATVAGIMLAFAIPFSSKGDDARSPSYRLEHILHKPVAFVILPIFALANTAVTIDSGWMRELTSPNSLGIAAGLLIGKPLGLSLACFAAVYSGICRLPEGLRWRHVFGAGLLGGIGFTMSIFINNLAFAGNAALINDSKIAIFFASLTAGIAGYAWLALHSPREQEN